MSEDTTLIFKDECYAIIGSCMRVHSDKGNGFLEPVYQECLEIDFELEGIGFVPQATLQLEYRGRELKHHYKPDFFVFDQIILEIKAVKKLTDEHRSQVLNYLSATGYPLGLLVNFGAYGRLEWERIANTK
ncbi:GxxExxY protein [Coraliomargarita parva]|uniref:GxxExxY protein n=1 Tax=Coraliomargarita parva TaxID=3014050 RepID=UPI0022B2D0D1|nr:GxxExxY protein [Coraliomargarita parva]